MSEVHRATVRCAVDAEAALAFLADGQQLGRWAMGCWQTKPVGGGVVRGHSLFDGKAGWVRPVMDAWEGIVTYHVGDAPDLLAPRVVARVRPEPGGTHCSITLEAERTPGMDDARWLRLVRCHEVEVLLIEAQLARSGT